MCETLNDCFDKLKPKEQEFLVWCLQTYGGKPDLTRGLLPFVSKEAAHFALERKIYDQSYLSLPADHAARPVGLRFMRGILDKLNLKLKAIEDQATVVMFLKDEKVFKRITRFDREGKRLTIATHHLGIITTDANEILELRWLAKDKWRVTCNKKSLDVITTHLAEHFR